MTTAFVGLTYITFMTTVKTINKAEIKYEHEAQKNTLKTLADILVAEPQSSLLSNNYELEQELQ